MTISAKKDFISSKLATVCFVMPPLCGLFSIRESTGGGLSYETKKSLHLQALYTAADRNRTGTGITTHGILSPGRLPVPPLRHMDGGGFEPPKASPADLQSVPFGHSGNHPCACQKYSDKI